MTSRWAYALLLSATAVSLIGCGDDPVASTDAGSDVAMTTDLGGDAVAPDTGTSDAATDGATPDVATDAAADVTAPEDGGKDAATPVDAADTGTPDDVTTPADVTTPLDVTTPDDVQAPIDVPVPEDVGTPDVPTPEDVSVDTGPTPADAPGPGFGCMFPRGVIALPGTVAPLLGSTTGGTSSISASLCQPNASGPEHVYTVQVASRTGVIFDTDAMSGTTFDTVLSLRSVCENTSTELSCDDDSGDTPGNASVMRAVLDPGMYALVVDGYNNTSGNYTLRTTLFDAAPNATCNSPAVLPLGDTLTDQSLVGAGAPSRACRTGSLGGQLFYSLTVPGNTTVQAVVTPTGTMPTWTPVLRVLSNCTDTTCFADAQGGTGTAATAVFANGTPGPQTYIVSVASTAVTTGTFSLRATQMMGVATGATCDNATVLAPGATLMAQDTSTGLGPSTVCQTNGRQLFYRVSVPAGQRVRVTATPPTSPSRTAVLRVLDTCLASTCAQSATGSSGSPVSTTLVNAGGAPRDFFVSASSDSSTTPMVFSLAASAAMESADGDTCDAPATLTPGMTLANQDTATAFQPAPSCLGGGAVRYYAVMVPAGQRVTVRATPSTGLALRIRSLSNCTATTCIESTTGTAGTVTPFALSNWSGMMQRYILAIGSSSTSTQGTYSLTTEQAPLAVRYTSTFFPPMCDDLSMGSAVQPSGGWSDDSATAIAALPFPFAFMGTMATHYSVASNGFAQLWPSSSGTPSDDYTNIALVGSGPANMIAPFWDDLTTISGAGTGVRVANVGMGIDRRFVIGWNNWAAVNAIGTSFSFQAKLFETTGAIEFHYCAMVSGSGLNGGRATGDSATVGVQNAMRNAGIALSHNMAGSVTVPIAVRLTPTP